MKNGHYLMIAGALVLVTDVIAGVQAINGSTPAWFNSTLGMVEGYIPVVPLWLLLVSAGAGLNYYEHGSLY